MRRLLIVVLAWSALAVGNAVPAHACSCAAFDPVDGLREAEAAFVGTFVGKGDGALWGSADGSGVRSSAREVGYRFRVEHVLKGDIGATVTVYAAADGASCGLEFHGNPRTGVLLHTSEGRWRSSLCRQVDADRLLAGSGGVARPPEPAPNEGPHLGSVALLVGLTAAVATVARRSVRRSG